MNIIGWLTPIVIIIGALAIAKFAHLNKLSWKYITPAILIPNLPVAVWDYYFTDWGVWQFAGGSIYTVVLFYVAFSLLTLSTYYIIKERVTKDYLTQTKGWILSIIVFIALMVVWITNIKTTFISIPSLYSAFLVLIIFVFYKRDYTQSFYLTYLSLIVPYLIIKQIQIATGYLTYNKDMLTGVYILDIPIEEIVVLFAIVVMTVIVFEYWFKKWPLPKDQ